MKRRIYLDHAATRFPKPAVVLETMHSYSAEQEAAVGRGAYRSSQAAGELVTGLRRELAHWIDAASDREISLHTSGTDALNTAILGLLRPGDHVVTTAAEHNSVLRPLHHLAMQQVIEITVVPVDQAGTVDADAVLRAVRPETRLVAVVHAANVNGAVQPVRAIGHALATAGAEHKPLLLCDAAQTFGHMPLSVAAEHLDLLAAPGHKGGGGPLGTGFLYVRRCVQHQLLPTRFGGTGTQSESLEMPTDFPSAFEAGNLNVPALAGWRAGLNERRGDRPAGQVLEATAERMRVLAEQLHARLEAIPNLRVVGRPAKLDLPVASLAVPGLAASEAALILDTEFGIEVRSGFHCAALVHQAIASPPDGTLRVSCGETTESAELDALVEALAELCG